MTMAQEAGNVVKTVTEGFRGNPSCLAAILLAAMMAVLTYMSFSVDKRQSHERFMLVLHQCFNEVPASKRDLNTFEGTK